MKSIICLVCSAAFVRAEAQPSNSMGQMLDQVDQPQNWSKTPVQGARQTSASPQNSASYFGAGQGVAAPMTNAIAPQANQQPSAQQNPFTLQNIFKTMMGGGGGSGNSSNQKPKDDSEARGIASENLQTARDQAEQANDDAGAIGGISDNGEKESRAESARYHAQAACEAADRAYEAASSSGSSAANDIASSARAAADRAQAAADRATAKASGGGW